MVNILARDELHDSGVELVEPWECCWGNWCSGHTFPFHAYAFSCCELTREETHTHRGLYLHTSTFVHALTHRWAHMCMCTWTHTHTLTDRHLHAHIYTCIDNTCMYFCTHSDLPKGSNAYSVCLPPSSFYQKENSRHEKGDGSRTELTFRKRRWILVHEFLSQGFCPRRMLGNLLLGIKSSTSKLGLRSKFLHSFAHKFSVKVALTQLFVPFVALAGTVFLLKMTMPAFVASESWYYVPKL